MIALVCTLVALVLLVAWRRGRRSRKARSAVGADGLPPFVVLTADDGRVRHRVPARRGWAGSRGAM